MQILIQSIHVTCISIPTVWHLNLGIFNCLLTVLVLKEISERADWIKEMDELGEGKKYRLTIRAEIADRLNQIKKLEKLRENKSKEQTIR